MDHPTSTSLLIFGLGSATHGDDGLGAVAVEILSRTHFVPEGVRVAHGETALPEVDAGAAALFVTAVQNDGPPGAFVRLAAGEVDPELMARLPASCHGPTASPRIVLGLVAGSVAPGAGLSRPVEAGLAGLVKRMVLEARHLGHVFRPRQPGRVALAAPSAREGR